MRVIRGHAAFLDHTRLQADGTIVTAKTFVVAAGSRAAIPPIEGLDPKRVLTNETIFDVETVPEHLIVLGAGPIGVEMAQAHRRMGSRVTIVDLGPMLPKDDPEIVAVLRDTLRGEGIEILENVKVSSVAHGPTGHAVTIEEDGRERALVGSHLLVATGRKANVEGLDLDRAGIAHDGKGIHTDARLRTTNRRVYAIGDIAGGPQFTHVAGYHAGIVIRNIAFRLPAKVDYTALPWVTFCDPELAHVGMTLAMAREKHGDAARSLTFPFRWAGPRGRRGKARGAAEARRHQGRPHPRLLDRRARRQAN